MAALAEAERKILASEYTDVNYIFDQKAHMLCINFVSLVVSVQNCHQVMILSVRTLPTL